MSCYYLYRNSVEFGFYLSKNTVSVAPGICMCKQPKEIFLLQRTEKVKTNLKQEKQRAVIWAQRSHEERAVMFKVIPT